MEGVRGLLVIHGLGLLLVGVLSMPEQKRAKEAGYAPGFAAESALHSCDWGASCSR